MFLTNNAEVTVRDFSENDISNKVSWINNSENNQFLHYDLPLSYEGTLKWYKCKNKDTRHDCVIEYQGEPVGLIGLLNIDKENSKAEFYISMGVTSFKRKGIATIATKLLLDFAFFELRLNKVYLNVDAENIAACRLYEKVGFKCEGIFKKDMYHRGKFIDRKRYAVLTEEYIV